MSSHVHGRVTPGHEHLGRGAPPGYRRDAVLHGTEDEQAPFADMRRMEARMQALAEPAAFKFYDGVPHGFAVRTHPGFREDAARQSFDEARRFLAMHMRAQST